MTHTFYFFYLVSSSQDILDDSGPTNGVPNKSSQSTCSNEMRTFKSRKRLLVDSPIIPNSCSPIPSRSNEVSAYFSDMIQMHHWLSQCSFMCKSLIFIYRFSIQITFSLGILSSLYLNQFSLGYSNVPLFGVKKYLFHDYSWVPDL